MKRSPRTNYHGRNAACLLLASLIFTGAIRSSMAAVDHDQGVTPNLAALNSGAQIECTTPDGRVVAVPTGAGAKKDAAALLTDDETLRCPLQEGQTTFVIKLPQTSLLDRFTFVNENATAAGELKISVSNYQLPASSTKWVDVDGNITFSRKRLFNVSLVGVEARYMKLSFNVAKGGRIASVGLYGGQSAAASWPRAEANQQLTWMSKELASDQERKPEQKRKKDGRSYDFADLHAKAQVVFVSSNTSPSTARMIDDDNETAFRFAETDARPTVIVELAQSERIHRVTANYKMQCAGRLDVYLLNDISKSATDINYQKPVASVTEQNSDGEASVNFAPEGARYVALRFTPADGSGGCPDFEVAEINAYGDVPLALLDALEAPDVYARSSTGTRFPGEGGQELSSSLGTLAVPPAIPDVSP